MRAWKEWVEDASSRTLAARATTAFGLDEIFFPMAVVGLSSVYLSIERRGSGASSGTTPAGYVKEEEKKRREEKRRKEKKSRVRTFLYPF